MLDRAQLDRHLALREEKKQLMVIVNTDTLPAIA